MHDSEHTLSGLQELRTSTRVWIENVQPQIDCGRFPVKRALGEKLRVDADVIVDGHDRLTVVLRYRARSSDAWVEVPMAPRGNDLYEAELIQPGPDLPPPAQAQDRAGLRLFHLSQNNSFGCRSFGTTIRSEPGGFKAISRWLSPR